ncbi:hypothetical protein [Pseudomonas putida]|uniref:Uncharacterized protein n=1 Tax=Pseudomonas putida TaxID=303 RepID=A0AAW6PM08_PSEPU|nr:hypothetical protein [Pseudomonas putida]MDF3871061.1 hypothetical protein [Pseudomonas putida]MDF3876865.1 hypothetical protein [Pseudomonas putida]
MKDKIIINGTPPAWDQAEYESRVASWVHAYRHTEKSMELVSGSLGHEFLQAVIDKAQAGYTITHTKRLVHAELYHSTYMVKPLEMQQQDIEAIKAKVKSEYVEWLESEHARYQSLLREQLVQAQEEKERKAVEAAKAKQLVAIEKEVQACYKPLVIPD